LLIRHSKYSAKFGTQNTVPNCQKYAPTDFSAILPTVNTFRLPLTGVVVVVGPVVVGGAVVVVVVVVVEVVVVGSK